MLAVRGSLRRRSLLSHPAVRGSLRRRSRLSHPAVSRDFMPRFAAQPSRRSWELTPPFAAQPSRRSAGVHAAVADQPAQSSQEMTPPSTANPSLPACLWLNARRPASDSMPAGLPLTQCPPDCRWLKLAGLPLTQARRIAADSSSPDCRWLMPAGRRWQGKPTRSSVHAAVCGSPTPPFAGDHAAVRGESHPPSAAASSVAGKANPPSAVSLSPQPAEAPPARRPLPLCGQARRLLPLFVKPADMVSPAGRCRIDKPASRGRIWPVSDHGLFNCFCAFSPGGLLIPLSFPKEIWGGGGVVGLRPKRLRWGLGPRSRRRSHHGLPSSLLRHGLPSSCSAMAFRAPCSAMASRAPCSAMASRAPCSARASWAPCSTWTSVCLFHSGDPVLCMYLCRSGGVSRVPTPPPW